MTQPHWESIPAELAQRRQWLLWRSEAKPGQAKPAKMPYYAKGTRREGTQGSDKDRARLVDLAGARTAFERGTWDGVGFALLPGDGLAGIDLDKVIDPTSGEIRPQAMAIVQAFASYTEYSPSGTGLHILVHGTTTTNKSNEIGVELFCGRQYFTFTGQRVPDTPADVLPASATAFKRLHATINQAKAKRKGEPAKVALTLVGGTDDFKRVNEAALAALHAWVPELLPAAVPKGDGYRITSKALNRSNQEDLSIMPAGIVDFGLEGTGDPRDGRRTPIDLVMEWGSASKPKDALAWLAKRLGVTLAPPKAKMPATVDSRPAGERFSCDDDGLWYHPPEESPKRICNPLHVTAWARDQYDNGAALLVEFTNIFGQARRHLLPAERLAGDGAQIRAELNSLGFLCPTDMNRRRWFLEYLLSRRPTERVRYVPKVGWWGNCFVLPHETLGNGGGERVIFWSDAPIEGGMSQRGTLQAWQNNLARLAIGNSRLTLCICMAFAAPLMHWAVGIGGGGLYLIGNTSMGKTTGGQIAASVYGEGAEGKPNSFIQKARATSNGAEYQAEHFNDGLLVLDELIHLEPADAGATIYTLADGVGKERARAAGGLRRKPTWTVMILTSSEVSLAQHMETANKRARGGLDVRLIGVPAEVVPKSMFETTHEFDGGSAMADWIKAHVSQSYGTVGRKWIEYLVDHVSTLSSELRRRMEVLEEQLIPDSAAGQVRRGGRRFCLIAAAGEMATEAGLTGWPKGAATQHVQTCFNAWTASRDGGLGSSDDAQIIAQVRQFIAEHGQLRLPDISRDEKADDRAPRTGMRIGWSKISKKRSDGTVDIRDYYFFLDAFRNIVCKGISYKSALALLRDKGYLVPGHVPTGGTVGRFDRREYHPLEGPVTVYRIRSTILDSEATT
jgi:uncharacterized protein (DUF927 family)